LAFDPNERVLRAVSDIRRSNDHASLVHSGNLIAGARNAVRPAKRSEIGHVVAELRTRLVECETANQSGEKRCRSA
jgi:hypothetical protein